MIIAFIQAFQLGRDGGAEALVFVNMYLPCQSRGSMKRFGFGPKAEALAQDGFVKRWMDEFEQYCILQRSIN
jgi:hypothetical protein